MPSVYLRSAPVSPTHYSSSGIYTPGDGMSREGSDVDDDSGMGSAKVSSTTPAIQSTTSGSRQHTSSINVLQPSAQNRLLQLHGAAAVRTIQSAPGSPQGKTVGMMS